MKVAARRRRPAGRPYVVDHRPRSGSATRPAAMDAVAALWATRCSSSRPAPGRASASPRSPTPGGLEARDRGGARARPEGASSRQARSSAARSSAACSQGRDGTDRRGPACSARSRSSRGDHEFYDFEAKYLADGATSARRARPTCPTAVAGRGAASWRRGRSRRWAARGWPASTSSYTETGDVVVNEINTMPGFTPLSMFPRMWAATRAGLPRAGRRADPLALPRRTGLR